MAVAEHIIGTTHQDVRGKLSFFNTLDLTEVKRMYQIEPLNKSAIRAWQGHKLEKKWFYCLQGSFIINLVKVTDFENADRDATSSQHIIEASKPSVLLVEGGYASGIKANAPHSKVLVFSNFTLKESQNDDYRFSEDYWNAKWH